MRPDAAAANHLEWALQWGPLPWAMVVVVALLVLGLSAWNLRQLASWPRRAVLFLYRTLTIGALLAVLAQPTWVKTAERPGGRQLAVVVDRSQSMQTGEGADARWRRAVGVAAKLAGAQPSLLFAAGAGLQPVQSIAQLAALQPTDATTDLLGALQQLAASQRAGTLGGVVVLSDGLDNGALSLRNPDGASALDADSAEALAALRAPIHGVLVDDPKPVRDVAVAAVRSSAFGFARTFLPVRVELELSGYTSASGELTLTLSDNGEIVATERVPLAGPPRRTIPIEIQPVQVGHHVLQAEVAALPDEVTDANNRAATSLRAVRERTRVLHLAGHPSWDTRFLRLWLRGNPAVDLISFYVMVGQGSGMYVSAEDTTLIPFPTEEIFEQSLSSFDLLIFQDFPFGPFQVDRYLPQLQRYLTGGGALLVLGGPQSLSAGGYHGTQVADWLPLRLLPLQGADPGFADGPVVPRLTPAGKLHPVSRLHPDADVAVSRWQSHGLIGRNTALTAAEQGQVLVTDESDHPLLAVGELGSGRSAVLASDSLWTWAFAGEDDKSDNREQRRADYVRLLDQLTGWLLRDPEMALVQLELLAPQPPSLLPRLQVTARGAGGEPLVGAALSLGRTALGPLAAGPAASEVTLAPLGIQTDANGRAVLALDALPPGVHNLTVGVAMGGQTERATLPVVLQPGGREAARLQPTDQWLQLLARASEGRVWTAGNVPGVLPLASRDLADVADKVHEPLWNHPAVLVLLVGLLTLEWTFRRRWGLA